MPVTSIIAVLVHSALSRKVNLGGYYRRFHARCTRNPNCQFGIWTRSPDTYAATVGVIDVIAVSGPLAKGVLRATQQDDDAQRNKPAGEEKSTLAALLFGSHLLPLFLSRISQRSWFSFTSLVFREIGPSRAPQFLIAIQEKQGRLLTIRQADKCGMQFSKKLWEF